MRGRDEAEFAAALALGAFLGASVALLWRQLREAEGLPSGTGS